MNILQKLFAREKQPAGSNANLQVAPQTAPPSPPLQLPPGYQVGKKTDIGQMRQQNQDSYYAQEAYLESSEGLEPFGLFIVADGMGGYQKGDIASNLAARASANYILKHIYLPYLLKDTHGAAQTPINEVLTAAVITANNTVLQYTPEAGTTLTIAVLMGHHAYLAHVGDSRAYVYHNGELKQITQDHSLVARLVELGQATAEEAMSHPQRNVLYRAIGQTATLEVETYLQTMPPNSYLLLCSDGLWGQLNDEQICYILQTATSAQDGANKLVDAANAAGGDDNITALLIGVGE